METDMQIRVYDETATQNDIFIDSVQPFLISTLQGQNLSIFAYGSGGQRRIGTMLQED
uniref:Kinesin motor domain-containing protein n=1 Tax=Arion vulgaris TaxID=1028688 RepID=A0A0B7AKN4_9EUPU